MNQNKNQTYQYNYFGFTLISDIDFPELLTRDLSQENKKPIYLNVDEVEDKKNYPNINNNLSFLGKDRLLLYIKNVAWYLVVNNEDYTKVTVDLIAESSINDAKPWLFGTVLIAALQLNNCFTFHASANNFGGEAVLFSGVSGAGKSSLAAFLNQKGYPIFSDDKCAVSTMTDGIYAINSLKILRLWENALDTVQNKNILTNQTKVKSKEGKFEFTLNVNQENFKPKKIKALVVLRKSEKIKKTFLHKIENKNRKRKLLLHQVHRFKLALRLQKKDALIAWLNQLEDSFPVYILARPESCEMQDFHLFTLNQLQSKNFT